MANPSSKFSIISKKFDGKIGDGSFEYCMFMIWCSCHHNIWINIDYEIHIWSLIQSPQRAKEQSSFRPDFLLVDLQTLL